MEHTPGPWEIEPLLNSTYAYTIDHKQDAGCNGVPPYHREHIAEIVGGLGDDVDEANAHLIAVAPDLLAMCEALLDALLWASGSPDFAPGGVAREGWLKVQPTVEGARVVIAKARGGAGSAEG